MTPLLNRLLRPFGLVVVRRTDWVDAMLDRRQRERTVNQERRKTAQV